MNRPGWPLACPASCGAKPGNTANVPSATASSMSVTPSAPSTRLGGNYQLDVVPLNSNAGTPAPLPGAGSPGRLSAIALRLHRNGGSGNTARLARPRPGIPPPATAALANWLNAADWQGKPSRIDPSPGYRWPAIDQVAAASREAISAQEAPHFAGCRRLPRTRPRPAPPKSSAGAGAASLRFNPRRGLPETRFLPDARRPCPAAKPVAGAAGSVPHPPAALRPARRRPSLRPLPAAADAGCRTGTPCRNGRSTLCGPPSGR